MNFRLIQKSDVDKLFQFELENRPWFEKHIAARDENFYSKFKIEKHIVTCYSNYQAQKMYPAIIELDSKIIARVNLRNINLNAKSADLGYRVAEGSSGKGVASFAVGQILDKAKNQLSLELISSYVSIANIASQKVLEKFGFKQIKLHKNFAVVSAKQQDCYEYLLKV